MSDSSVLNWLLFLVLSSSVLLLLTAYNLYRHIAWHLQEVGERS